MHDELFNVVNESMFEFAFVCQEVIKAGWKFAEIGHGDRRLGIGPSLIIIRGSEVKRIYNSDELARMIESPTQDSSHDNMHADRQV